MGTPSYERKARVSPVAGCLCSGCSRSGDNHLANAGSIMAKALPGSMDSWLAIVEVWDLFSFWSPKVDVLFA